MLLVVSGEPGACLLSRTNLVTLRGGSGYASSSRQLIRSAQYSPVDETRSFEMSDAERVYVVQAFAISEVRKRFLRQVLSIVAIQLAATAGVIAAVRALPELLLFLARAPVPVMLAPLVPAFWLQKPGLRPTGPASYILLGAYTLLQALALGLATGFLPARLVLQAAWTSAIAVGSLCVYALTTKRDFTVHGGILTAGLTGFVVFCLLQFFLKGRLCGHM